jgi:hypothetical protein
MVVDPSVGERSVAVICLTLITSNPRLTSPSYIYPAWVLCGRWRITVYMSLYIKVPVILCFCVYSLAREHVYRNVAQQ